MPREEAVGVGRGVGKESKMLWVLKLGRQAKGEALRTDRTYPTALRKGFNEAAWLGTTCSLISCGSALRNVGLSKDRVE